MICDMCPNPAEIRVAIDGVDGARWLCASDTNTLSQLLNVRTV